MQVKVVSSNVGTIYVSYCYLLVNLISFVYIILEIDNYKLL